ncbi:hypothetical protein GCK72_019204 [Caenorhabditis remanei]|nr:hypothetical protein GCK72_019204 [Caenorhabditis remanei]KAF1752649.1 hypothetical protein GCK72_019204 [Caenorhabditis remanei]
MLVVILILIQLQDVIGFKCLCSGNIGSACPDGCDAGSYCVTTWIVAHGAVRDQGCKTTRTDLSDRQCQTNRKGLVSCVCSSEKCNDASFAIPSDVALIVPPVIKCFSQDLNEDNFCFGHYCTYSAELVMNDFGDVFPTPYKPTRGCSDDEYSDDLNSVNVCTSSNNIINCKCNTEFCNRAQPFPVPLGNVLCYMSSAYSNSYPVGLKYCRGHLCYIMQTDYEGKVGRGCLSVSDGAPEELKKPGAYLSYKYCDQDLCNGDFMADAPSVINGEGSATTPQP